MAIDWSLQLFGPAGELHAALLSIAAVATLLMGARKIDGKLDVTWWTVMSPLITAAATSLYIYVITITRLRVDSKSRFSKNLVLLVIPSVVLMVLLLATFALMARLLEHHDIAPAVACVPLYITFFVCFYLPDPDPGTAPR